MYLRAGNVDLDDASIGIKSKDPDKKPPALE